jgi:bacteriochlorophyll 4-vinyl reductase
MSEQRMVEIARLRGLLDGIAAVGGEKSRAMALRHVGLEEYIDNPPAMNETELVPAEHYMALIQALSGVFGRGSKALLIYAGEETFRHAMDGMPRLFGPVLKFMPGGMKRQAVFKMIATQSGQTTGVPCKVEFEKGKVTLADPVCCSCYGRQSDEPVCHFETGVLLAAAEVATGKKNRVTEVKCKAMGDEACVWVIEEIEGDA